MSGETALDRAARLGEGLGGLDAAGVARLVELGAAKPPLEGPFTYRSGWVGRYDPAEGRYLGQDDVYMPRDFDPDTALPRAGS